MTSRLYFRQLLSGQDFAVGDPVATQMANFVYLIGDLETGEALMIDPAYNIAALLDVLDRDGLRLSGVLATHYHPDHVGGTFNGYPIQGVRELLECRDVKIHVNRAEAPWVRRMTDVSSTDLVEHDSGDRVAVGAIEVQLLHTPGHTPGSQCFLVEQMLISGDTLFLEGCGRTDLPGSDTAAMYDSLQRLASLADDTAVFPGHHYSPPASGTLGEVKELNFVFKPRTKEQWVQMFGPRTG